LGAAESEGLELDLSGQITDTMSIWFAYAYVDAKTSNDVINADWGVNIPAGSPLVNIPEHSGSITLSQQLDLAGRPAAIGVGVNYVGDRLGQTIDPSYELPAYTLVKLFASYSMTDKIKFTANVDNLFDEDHYQSSYHKLWTMPGAPLTYKLGVQYSL
jgi:iron complex outermembrane receptor protein